MRNRQKLLIIISGLFMILFCLIFTLNSNYISGIINQLNGNSSYNSLTTKPNKKPDTNRISLVNTAELGKYKINKALDNNIGYSNIDPNNINNLCDFIITNSGKICIICHLDNINSDLYIAFLQFLAGGDYDNIINYYLQNFNNEDSENAKNYFNQYFSSIFNVNIKDFQYLNVQKLAKNYLNNNGYSNDKIELIIAKLKEDCA